MELREMLKNKEVRTLCKHLFGIDITLMQERIVKAIAFKESRRIVISAYTRYGKTRMVALGVCLYILMNRDKRIALIAPTIEQTGILRNYIAEQIMKCRILLDLLEIESSGPERIKREVSRRRMTFSNGISFRVLTAEGSAVRLMGHGADLVIDDEDCLIDYDVYRQKISRMLGDSPDSIHVSIGNTWHRDNQMYQHWTDPAYLKIHVDWRTGVKEGRITQEFVDEQRQLLSPMEFTILYESLFPEESEDQLIRLTWIEIAEKRKMELKNTNSVAGLDVAEFGRDLTVLTKGVTDSNNYQVREIHSWSQMDTMQTVGKSIPHIDKLMRIIVDATGVGSGVHARLQELGYKAEASKVGSSPDDMAKQDANKSRFLNLKAQYYWRLRELFEKGMIDIPVHAQLRKELQSLKYEITSAGKIRIVDARSRKKSKKLEDMMVEGKSPDFADSLMLMCSGGKPGLLIRWI